MFTLVIEGWRAYPQSHSIIAQFHSLELLKRPDIRLRFVEAAQPPGGFLRVGAWKPAQGLLPAEAEAALAAIPAPQFGEAIDATLRLAFPVDFSPAEQGRTFAFAVAEGRRLHDYMIAGNLSLAQALEGGTTVITPSEFSRRNLIATGAQPSQVAVVPHGADPQIFHPVPEDERLSLRRARQIRDDEFVFLNVSALYRRKGTPFLLKAFAAISARYPEAVLLLKGIDAVYTSKAAVLEILESFPAHERDRIAKKIRYRGGSLPSPSMADLYRCADTFVSAYQLEGFNMPVLEAIACGLPVICTAGGPTDEFTQDEFAWRIDGRLEDDWLVPDVDHLVHLMEKSIHDRDWRTRTTVAGPAFVAQNHTWAKTTDKLLDVMRGSA